MRLGVARSAGALLVAAALTAGCGGDDGDPRGRGTGQDARSGPASADQVERFARVDLPPSTRDLKAKTDTGIDQALAASFSIDRADLDRFVKSARFAKPPEGSDRAIVDRPELGWRLGGIRRLRGVSEIRDGLGRNVLIDLDDPDRAVVYLEATTL